MAPANCPRGQCNPLNFTILKPESWQTQGVQMGLRIDGKGIDPGVYIWVGYREYPLTSKAHSVFHSFYEEMEKPFSIPQTATNLFISLAEVVGAALNVSSCYVCGGTNMGDQWPWETREYNYSQPYNATGLPAVPRDSMWPLQTSVIGKYCASRACLSSSIAVRNLTCTGGKFQNHTTNTTEPWGTWNESDLVLINRTFPNLITVWNSTAKGPFTAPNGLYWICGKVAFRELPRTWCGTCMLGTIKPSFFLIPLTEGKELSQPVYQNIREKRAVITWGGEEWPPERIIQYYGPATWAEDGMWGYRTPIYMLNRIIRLQAVVEIITNETAHALNLLAQEQTKFRNAIYQNRLALDYLLAAEGGVCGKFNLSNCCLELDNTGKVIDEITSNIVKIAHVPVQTWNGWNINNPFGSWQSIVNNFKLLLGIVALFIGACTILPCL
nr:endogenous retrovirus group 3 member 1 Env polyprotein-like [Dasypus novemcinctus]